MLQRYPQAQELKKGRGKQILHLDMDAFFASVEQAANHKLKNKPLIVGSRTNRYRTVVAACSYEAKALGVKSGMSAQEAFRLCPEAIFLPADCSKYIYTSRQIFHILQEFSPQVEMASVDEFNLDITGCQKIFGSEVNIVSLIKQKIKALFNITGSVGIAHNKILAKLAAKSQKPNGLTIWPKKDIPQILQDMPVEKIPGIGPKISSYLQQISVFTCGQLAKVDPQVLFRQFGQYGYWLKNIARGEGDDYVPLATQEEIPPKSVSHSYTLESNIYLIDLIQAWIRLLCEMVAERLRNLLLAGSVVHLYLRGKDLRWWSRQKKFASTTSDGKHLYQRSLIILKNLIPQGASIRALGVSVSGLEPALQPVLFEEDKKRSRLILAIDQINARFGQRSIYPAHLAIIS